MQYVKFYFSGFGNFSTDHGWDEGLLIGLGNFVGYSDEYGITDDHFYTHAGSRNISGFVAGIDKQDCLRQLREIESNFPIIDYEP